MSSNSTSSEATTRQTFTEGPAVLSEGESVCLSRGSIREVRSEKYVSKDPAALRRVGLKFTSTAELLSALRRVK